MTNGNEILEKVITTTNLGAGTGLLNTQQSDRFIDYMWDSTALGGDARTIRMRSNTADIDRVQVGQRLVRVATESVDDHVNANATFSKISITTTKLRLDWELSTESLEDGIEGADLEDHIARLMATQMGNDLEDLAINGDVTSADPLLKAFDGWRKIAFNGAHVVDNGGLRIDKKTFNAALNAMPRKYKQRRNQMRFYTGSNLVQDYLFNLTTYGVGSDALATGVIMGTTSGPAGPGGGVYPFAFGVPVVEVPMYDTAMAGTYSGATGNHGDLELTFPQNRLWGVKREIQVFREFKPKKDTIEYTVFCRVGVQIENLDAWVIVTNVKVGATV